MAFLLVSPHPQTGLGGLQLSSNVSILETEAWHLPSAITILVSLSAPPALVYNLLTLVVLSFCSISSSLRSLLLVTLAADIFELDLDPFPAYAARCPSSNHLLCTRNIVYLSTPIKSSLFCILPPFTSPQLNPTHTRLDSSHLKPPIDALLPEVMASFLVPVILPADSLLVLATAAGKTTQGASAPSISVGLSPPLTLSSYIRSLRRPSATPEHGSALYFYSDNVPPTGLTSTPSASAAPGPVYANGRGGYVRGAAQRGGDSGG
jgi:hypothetical protein